MVVNGREEVQQYLEQRSEQHRSDGKPENLEETRKRYRYYEKDLGTLSSRDRNYSFLGLLDVSHFLKPFLSL